MPPATPFDPHRTTLYTPAELYSGIEDGYASTPDARIHAWDNEDRAVDRTLASALHDHAIDDALAAWTDLHGGDKTLVGVMGGHAGQRGDPAYRDACRLGHLLAGSHTVATGGGPGAMEAANLGAFLPAEETAAGLHAVVDRLAAVPSYSPDTGAWARLALDVRRDVEHDGGARDNLGVPTWFYGHEPPNVFATAIAKYFRNAIREDVLLRRCGAGLVFLPGAAGTVQEIFQDACENYYAEPDESAPMVLVGREHWTTTLPAWPLLQALAGDAPMRVHLVDRVEDAVELLD